MAAGRPEIHPDVACMTMSPWAMPYSPHRFHGPLAQPVDEEERAGRASLRVVVVEDEAMIAWMLQSLLEDIGFCDVCIASSAEDAMDKCLSHPDLLLTDINLGVGLDGVELARRLHEGAELPVVFISGYADDAMRQRVADAVPGAPLLRKPISTEPLDRAISEVLKRNHH